MRLWIFLFFLLCNQTIAAIPRGETLDESCDLMELNHFYDDNEKLVFTQLIFRDWHPTLNRYVIRAWRMSKDGGPRRLNEKELKNFLEFSFDKYKLKDDVITKLKNDLALNSFINQPIKKTRPIYSESCKKFYVILEDGDNLRKISAPVFRETWTQYDPELEDREYLPKEQRTELRQFVKKK